MRAMETAGRAVVFSGTTVAIGLLALVALPLPFLRSVGYGGMLIPLVSVAVGAHAAAGRAGKLGPAARLAAPAHRRQGEPRLDALGRARRAPPLDRGGRRVAVVLARSWSRPRTCSSASPNLDTIAKQGDAKAGLVRARATRASAPARCCRTRCSSTGHGPASRSRSACAASTASTARSRPTSPRGARTAPRSSTPSRTADGSTSAGARHARPRARRRARAGPDVRVGGGPGAERRLHRRRLRQLPADDRADRDHHVHAARARVPLAAAAARRR